MDRQQVVKDAEIALENLSTGARLPEDRWKEFVQRVREKAVLRDYITVAEISESGKLLIPWIEVPENVMGLAQGLLNPADYNMAEINNDQNTLQTFDVETVIFIPDDWKDGNFQQENGVSVVLDLFASQFAANMEQAGLYSNALGPAVLESKVKKGGSSSNYVKFAVRSKQDGWLEKMESGTVVDAENSDDIDAVFGEAMLEFPTRYDMYMDQLRWFAPSRLKAVQQINLARRETSLGDLAKNGSVVPKPYGYEILSMPLLESRPPEVEHVTLTGTTAVTLQYKPLVSSEVKVFPSTLGTNATAPYILGTDYNFTGSTAEIVRPSSGSNITSGATVKVQYQTGTKCFFTFPKNLVMGLTRDISITPWYYAPGRGTFYFIRAKVGYHFLNQNANVLIKNLKLSPIAA